jgi:hypothetical protein
LAIFFPYVLLGWLYNKGNENSIDCRVSMLVLRQAISAIVGVLARIVWNVCEVSGPAVVGIPANNNGGVSGHADVLPMLSWIPTAARQ